MKIFCKKLCCAIFCCSCCFKKSPLKSIDEDTRLLPKNEKTKAFLEKDQLYPFGVVPESLRGQVIDLAKYTKSFVRKVVCGNNHCLILFNDGQLAGFGSNEEGQLGFELKKEGNYINEIKTNKLVILDPGTQRNIDDYEIWDIGAGENFSLILIKSKLKTFLVRLGINPEDKYSNEFGQIKPVNVVPLEYERIFIKNIYVFGQRSLLLTSNNDLYVGGLDFDLNPLNKYKHVEHFAKEIRSIHLGLEHCLILDFEGGVYGIGNNTYGELGLDDISTVDRPIRLSFQFTSNVKKIAVGARHSMILLENGELYAFGDNSEGQCTGFHARYSFPVRVEVEVKEKIIDIYCGYNHNLIVLNNGEMYTWGDSSSGKLGYLEANLTQYTPKIITVLKGKFANCICLGFQMTVISTSSYENSLVNYSLVN